MAGEGARKLFEIHTGLFKDHSLERQLAELSAPFRMAVGVYNRRTLNDNWFEDRLQPPENLSTTLTLDKKAARPVETDFAAAGGQRHELLSRISRMPPRRTYATPDDGYHERDSSYRKEFPQPLSRATKGHQSAPALINTENAPVKGEEPRPLSGPASGFGAGINRHDERHHEKRYLSTTYGDFHGYNSTWRGTERTCNSLMAHAGMTSEAEEKRVTGLKVGRLVGESHRESSNPAVDSRTQRAWLYSEDASLRNIHLGGRRGPPAQPDNELSLPLGDGAMSKVRADLKSRKGFLYQQASYITKGKDKRKGLAIWQDWP